MALAEASPPRSLREAKEVGWTIEEEPSLDGLDPAALGRMDAVARDPFHTPAWLRMLATLDLSREICGRVTLRYVVARRGDSVAALCPVLEVGEPTVYHWYNLEKSYFTQALDEVRLEGDSTTLRLVQHVMRGWNSLLRLLRIVMWRALIVVSPLSYRSDILVLSEDPAEGASARERIVAHLKSRSESERRPLVFLGVEEDNPQLVDALRREDLVQLFYLFDGRLAVTGDTFDEFLRGLPRPSVRERYRREIRAAERCGLKAAIEADFAGEAERLARLYELTYERYGSDHFRHGVAFFRAVQSLGPSRAVISTARDSGGLLSFALLIRHRGDVYNLRVGTDYTAMGNRPGFFSASFYEPVRYALREKCSRFSLGLGAFDIKHRRGGTQSPLYLFLHLPGPWSRYLATPYLRAFAEGSRRIQQNMAGSDDKGEKRSKVTAA